MALGQAAGVAASLAIEQQIKVRNVNVSELQKKLLDQNTTLMYFRDVSPADKNFKMIQHMGLLGYLPEWKARLSDTVDQQTAEAWQKLSGKKLNYEAGKTTRGELLLAIFQGIRN
jgi:hypothetical protein